MQYKFSTTVSEKGSISIPFNHNLFNKTVEVIIIPQVQEEPKMHPPIEKELSFKVFIDTNDALYSNFEDFEDAVQYHAALTNVMDIIVTRDTNDFEHSNIPVYLPEEL